MFLPAVLANLALLAFSAIGADFPEGEPPNRPPDNTQTILEILESATTTPFLPSKVRTTGGVTFCDPKVGKDIYIQDKNTQDKTGGILVRCRDNSHIAVGDYLEVEGVTARGDFAPLIVETRITNLGQMPLPPYAIASGGGVLNGAFHGRLVELGGWVRSARKISPSILQASVISGASRMTIQVSNAESLDPQALIATQFRAHGVASAVNARGITRHLVDVQLLVQSPADIVTTLMASPDPVEITPFLNIFQYRPNLSRGERLRVRGRVLYRVEETLFLNDGRSGLVVKSVSPQAFEQGQWVEAVGFCDLDNFLPALNDAVVQSCEPPSTTILPKVCSAKELFLGTEHANYVSVAGQLLDRVELPQKRQGQVIGSKLVLTLQSPEGVFFGELPNADTSGLVSKLEVGSTLKLTGICMVDTDDKGNAVGFKMLLPTPEKIAVLIPASFFTAKRLLVLLCLALMVLLGVVLRNLVITRRNAELVANIRERSAIASERSRLARDLHDSLEQGLTGISLHVRSVGKMLENTGFHEAWTSIETARRLVKQCHSELRQSIWELRSSDTEHFDLGGALKRLADSLICGLNLKVELRQDNPGIKLPPRVEDNLLRIGQEAITNAIKNAGATLIVIDLSVGPKLASLKITDNGCGFSGDIETHQKEGHYGIQGMRERAQSIGGQLSITNGEDAGCVVHVTVPIEHLQGPNAEGFSQINPPLNRIHAEP